MRLIASIVLAALCLLPVSGQSDERPVDPYLCLAPVPFGETGETRAAGRWPHPQQVQFLPGYPTPIFFTARLPGALYIDPEGRLRPHPDPNPSRMQTRYYLGSQATVLAWDQPGSTLFFDPNRGHFRPVEEATAKQRAELQALRERLREDATGIREIGWGGVHPIPAGRPPRSLGQTRSSAWRVTAPGLGVEIEANEDRLTLSKGDRQAEYSVPGLAPLGWELTELPQSGRVVLVSLFESRMLVVDEDLNLTRPVGEWRLPRQPEVLLLPETGEALVKTSLALFWLRDKRISGADICGDTEPPPAQPARLITPPGTEQVLQADNDRVAGFWPDPESGTVLLHSKHGLFRLGPDGKARKLSEAPDYHYQYSYPVPGTTQVLVNAGRRFVIVDGDDIVFDSGIIAERCCLTLRPVLRNPATGSVLLDDGRYLTRDYQLRQLAVPGTHLRLFSDPPAVASPAWLPGPLLGGFLWDENDELRSLGITLAPPRPDRLSNRVITGAGYWMAVDRFQFLMTIIKGWRKLDANLRLEQMPGQPDVYLNKTWGGGQPPTAIFDPGKGDVLLGLPEGLWAVRADGAMRYVECSDGCKYGHVSAIVVAPDEPGKALVAAAGGLFRYDPEAGGNLVRMVPIDRTGSVIRLHSVPSQGITLIEADFGNFVWDADLGLRRLDIEVYSEFESRFIVTHAPRRVFVQDRGLKVLEFPEGN